MKVGAEAELDVDARPRRSRRRPVWQGGELFTNTGFFRSIFKNTGFDFYFAKIPIVDFLFTNILFFKNANIHMIVI